MDRQRKRNMFICIAVVLALLAFRIATENSTVQMDLTDHLFTISWETYESIMDLNQVVSMELLSLSEPGICLDGFEDETLACGVWENDVWGAYHLYSYKEIECCIVIKTVGRTVAFNYESEQATQDFFEALTEYYDTQTSVGKAS